MEPFIQRRRSNIKPEEDTGLADYPNLVDMDSHFNRPFLMGAMWNGYKQSRIPPMNINESENEYILELAAPGLDKDDFEIDIDNHLLEIKVDKEEKSKNYQRREYSFHSFDRSFKLPENVKEDEIQAEYKDGILILHLPVMEAKRHKPSRTITVE